LGVYNEDDCEGIHPNAIQEYYGTTQEHIHRRTNQTGAGHPPEEYENDYTETNLIDEVIQDQDSDIRHDSIPTANHEAPSISSEYLTLFSDCLAILRNDDQGDLLRSVAGQVFMWDPVEVMRVGQRRQKELVISLEDATWERRALLWLAGLRVLDSLQ
jgi:hypothetical protein